MSSEPDAPSATLAALVIRAIGLYVLAGALAKLLLGTPADLPPAIRQLGFGLELTYQLVISIELAVTALALVLPWLAWPPLLVLLTVFLGVLGSLVASGAESCGCFGGNIKVPPSVMLGADVAALVLLLLVRPWSRLRRTPLRLLWLLPLLLAAGTAPWWVLHQRQTPGQTPTGYTVLEPHKWVGQELDKTELSRHLSADTLASLPFDGLFIFYSQTCPHCAEYLETLARDKTNTRLVTLIRVPTATDGTQDKVHVKPVLAAEVALPANTEWVIQVPTELILENSVIKSARVIVD